MRPEHVEAIEETIATFNGRIAEKGTGPSQNDMMALSRSVSAYTKLFKVLYGEKREVLHDPYEDGEKGFAESLNE